MDARSNEGENTPKADGDNVRERSARLKGGHDPAELGRKSGRARRERAKERQAAAEYDALTVSARMAVALAREATYEKLSAVVRRTIEQAIEANGQIQIQAARVVMEMAQLAFSNEPDEDDGSDLEKLTPEQRAVRRAALDKLIAEAEAAIEAERLQEGESEAPHSC